MGQNPMLRYLGKFEHCITSVLLVLMAGVVLLATLELAWILVKDVITPPLFLLEIDELLELFGLFLLVLIGIELLHSVEVYIVRRELHVETVLTVAMIAVARKVIVLEPDKLSGVTLFGIAALIFALASGYYLLRISRNRQVDSGKDANSGENTDSDH